MTGPTRTAGGASLVPVLEVGGTHVTAALVDTGSWTVAGQPIRRDLDAAAAAGQILSSISAAGAPIASPGARWSVALPDPFDYQHGIGRFSGVAKFESLNGVSVRSELLERLAGPPAGIVFCNDADAFTLGEWVRGAATGAIRVTGLTLGTGVGSGWVDGGRIIIPDDPPGGRIHQLSVDGLPLEEVMSRRAIRRAYAARTGYTAADVADIAILARSGQAAAIAVLSRALAALGRCVAGPIRVFEPDVIVVGGSMARSWDLFGPWFAGGAGSLPPVVVAAGADIAPLIGAAWFGSRAP